MRGKVFRLGIVALGTIPLIAVSVHTHTYLTFQASVRDFNAARERGDGPAQQRALNRTFEIFCSEWITKLMRDPICK